MFKVEVFIIESIEEFLLDEIYPVLEDKFQLSVERVYSVRPVYEGARGNQLLANAQLAYIVSLAKTKNFTLGITDRDLYSMDLNFVFGVALPFKGCVVSSARLVSADFKLFKSRWRKEVTHEMGHVFGLSHCSNPFCVMHFSNSVADTDRKGEDFCSVCRSKLMRTLLELGMLDEGV